MLPKITSKGRAPVSMFASIQPMKRPGIAAGVKKGSIVSASEKRTCMAQLARPIALAISVKITYIAAMAAA